MKRTFAYIDGYNLYYGLLKGTPYKWLNPVHLEWQIVTEANKSAFRFFKVVVELP